MWIGINVQSGQIKMKYYADEKGRYDKESVMRDIRNGVKEIEIDFSAYADALIKRLREQEKHYKK